MTDGRSMDLRDGERVRWTYGDEPGQQDFAAIKGNVWRDKKTKRLMAWILAEGSQAEFHVPVSELEALDVEAQRVLELLDAAEAALGTLKVAHLGGRSLYAAPVTKRLATAIAAAKGEGQNG